MRVLVAVPPEAGVTELGLSEQVPAAVPLRFDTVQPRVTELAKPFTEATVIVSVTLAPVVVTARSEVEAGVTVNVGPTTVTTIVDEETTVDPLVPLTVTFSVPLVFAVVFTVSVLVELPDAASVTEVGLREHVPAALPLALVTVQVSATVPAKLLTEAREIVAVLPVVAPALTVNALEPGVTVKLAACVEAAAVRKAFTSSDPRPVTSS